jgi:putative aldouronate transport system substrate-binding protein
MKRVIAILTVLLMAAAASFAGGKKEAGAAAGAPSWAPPMLEMTKAYYFDGGSVSDNPDQKKAWTEWLTKYYGFPFKMNAIPRPEYMSIYQVRMAAGEIKGMGWIFGGDYYMTYYNDGATLEIGQYLKDNPVWNALSAGYKDQYRVGDKYLGIAVGYAMDGFGRSIRQDWLDKLGMKLPKTIDEFYTAVKAFTLNDPDGNGKADTYGMTSSGVWNIQDIFQSFDAATNNVGDNAFTIDPNDSLRWVDNMLKPGMVDALNWLADCYANGYLDKETFTNTGNDMRTRMASGKYGSNYYWFHYGATYESQVIKIVPTAKFSVIDGLTSSRLSKNINPAGGAGSPWVLIAGTKEPSKVINAFVNIFFGDETGHFAGRWGVPDLMWKMSPQKVVTLQLTPDKKRYASPGIINELDKFNGTKYGLAVEGEDPSVQVTRMKTATDRANWFDAGFKSGMLWDSPNNLRTPKSKKYSEIGADISKLFAEAVTKAVTRQLTAQEAIANYRKAVKALGGQQALDESNAAIGLKSRPEYNY